MSLGSTNMAGNALGTAFSLLLYASIIQGLQDVVTARSERTEAVVGQNVTLACTVKRSPNLRIVNIEWRKKGNTKLALYSHVYGVHLFWPNVTIHIEDNDANELMGSFLQLADVKKQDGGLYICDIATFPFGSIRRETELKIKDLVRIMCDVDGAVNVPSGENVTIRCRASPDARYRWTKNKELVSENESLELWGVTAAHAGVYTLTVATGMKSLHREFTVTVVTATTGFRTDFAIVSTPSGEGLLGDEDSGPTTPLTTRPSTTRPSTTRPSTVDTVSVGTNPTARSPNYSAVTITAVERVSSFTNCTNVSVTSSPATQTDPNRSLNSTTLHDGSTEFRSTQEVTTDEKRNRSTLSPVRVFSIGPEESSTTGNVTEQYERSGATPRLNAGSDTEAEDNARSHLVALVVFPAVMLIAAAGFLYKRRIMKQRMALPPSFKPPPPPVKYTAVRHHEISTSPYPISRCNSLTEFRDLRLYHPC